MRFSTTSNFYFGYHVRMVDHESGLSVIIDSSEVAEAEHSSLDVPLAPYSYEMLSPLGPPGVSSRTRTVDATLERLWTGLSSLYSANEELKTTSDLKATSGGKIGHIAEKLDSLLEVFMNGADAVLDELSFLGNMHPVLAGLSCCGSNAKHDGRHASASKSQS
ncbi:hypothetical protein GALMADRAFT_438231 [Galerina marginata CBS 339.88]|uniref:Uncharacterized protein n=1 Tax=Galerina marginata (strain CBS 339.88) TaxID=685588 RepID=A0A067T4J0_GALM3|nr:hypothetical protein GALMADRAFT_438231 [Galerina marginata CBS 339.88]